MYYHYTTTSLSVSGVTYDNISVCVHYEVLGYPSRGAPLEPTKQIRILKIEKVLTEKTLDVMHNVVNIESLVEEIVDKELDIFKGIVG